MTPADMTPPPLKRWTVTIDCPFLPKADYEVEGRTEAEAKVSAAEVAVATAAEGAGPAKWRRLPLDEQVADVAGYATASYTIERARVA
jgi:hypothetical protein